MKKVIKYYLPVIAVLLMVSCNKDYLETMPSDEAPRELVFETTEGAYVAVNGMYRATYQAYGGGHDGFAQKALDLTMDLMGNDMVVNAAGYGWFGPEYRYTSQQLATAGERGDMTWTYAYFIIDAANNLLANVDAASGPTAEKEDIKGQALAMRAYSYFYLINCFQHTFKGNENKPGVPLYTAPTTEGKPRGTVQQVYTQIVADLTAAETFLTGKPRKHKSHVDIRTVQGIRARVALQMEDWPNAATYANRARTGRTPMSGADWLDGFSSIDNPEWIWGMEVINDQSTILASFFSHIDANVVGYALAGGQQKKITKVLYDQIPSGDIRRLAFTAPGTGNSDDPDYNQQKFRLADPNSWAGDYVYMRAAEMYLIEAEALARQTQEPQSRTVLETLVKARNPAFSAAALTGAALINAITVQRRIELWGEGFSLLDIKRLKVGLNRPTGAGNHGSPNLNPNILVMADQDPRFLFKIPQSEIDANTNMTMADQNP